jgi:small conductance mechanosensitive channel
MSLIEELVMRLQSMLVDLLAFLPRLVIGLIVAVLAFALARLARRGGERLADSAHAPGQVKILLVHTIYIVALLIGLGVTLGSLGIDTSGLIAGLGVTGLVVGLALRDILENLLAGALLLMRRPFDIGDYIEVGAAKGRVEDIRLRDTTLRTPDGRRVIVPNTVIYESIIVNTSAFNINRRELAIGLGYDVDLVEAVEVLLEAVRSVEGVIAQPEPFIALESLGDNWISAKLYFYLDAEQFSPLEVHSAALRTILEAAKRAGISIMPPPTQTVELIGSDR